MDTTAEEGTSDQGAQPGESANLDHQQQPSTSPGFHIWPPNAAI